MDFPVAPMDRLPIFPDEAASAAAQIELIGGAGRAEKESANGSHGAVVGGFGHSSAGQFGGGAMCGEETSMAAGHAAVSTQMPLTGAALKHILMEIRTLLFKIEHKVAMEALLNRLAKWLPKPLDGTAFCILQPLIKPLFGDFLLTAERAAALRPSVGGRASSMTQMNKQAHQDSVIADQAESGNATSAQSTGKMDPQVPGWTKRVKVGKHVPDALPSKELAPYCRRSADTRTSSVVM